MYLLEAKKRAEREAKVHTIPLPCTPPPTPVWPPLAALQSHVGLSTGGCGRAGSRRAGSPRACGWCSMAPGARWLAQQPLRGCGCAARGWSPPARRRRIIYLLRVSFVLLFSCCLFFVILLWLIYFAIFASLLPFLLFVSSLSLLLLFFVCGVCQVDSCALALWR